jgi:alkanesulfonate monooxygenase SsuD/methylene tetrahydromethanopterin reductase-like flavin-dependent oxidoreductase (luciferase family)
MKFHFFHLMPYPDLPDDFRQRYHGVWVDPPAAELYDPTRGHEVYNEYLDELEYADQVGFDGICVNEHHQNAYGLMPSPNLMVAALARRTTRAKLVIMGNSVALYNPPVRVAEEMAMLDVLSGGRIVAGFPVGTAMDTTFCYGETPATLREKYREGVGLVLRAWQEPKPFSFNGKYTQLRYVNVWPRPIQRPHPPVWIPASGSVETYEWCTENDFLYAYLSYFGYQRAQRIMDGFWETAARKGVDANPYRAGFLQFVAVAENDAEAERLYSKAALYFYNRCLHLYPGFVSPPGYVSVATIRRNLESQIKLAADRNQELENLTWSQILERGYVVAGSPDTVVQQLQEMESRMRVGHLMVLLHFGNMPRDTVTYNTTRFINEVAPRLRSTWSEWQDRWWPRDTLPHLAEPAPLPSAQAV